MQKKKLDFKDIKGMLSRDEMRQIKGGSDDSCPLKCSSSNCVGSCQCYNNGKKTEYCGSH